MPLLAEINAVRDAIAATALPKSPLGDAVRYLTNQWDALQRYVDDGRLAIDINRAENQLRVVAVGREHWLFAGSFDGATRAALLYSLVQSCTLIGVSPFTYLKDVLLRVATHPHPRLDQLTPWRWAATSVPGRRLTSFTLLGRLARRHDGVRRTLTPVRSTAPARGGYSPIGPVLGLEQAQLTVRFRQAENGHQDRDGYRVGIFEPMVSGRTIFSSLALGQDRRVQETHGYKAESHAIMSAATELFRAGAQLPEEKTRSPRRDDLATVKLRAITEVRRDST